MAKLSTPIIKNLSTSGGTFYTMPSATEDIGLNINERSNKVAISHYALLDLPADGWSFDANNAGEIEEALKNELQNYMFNLETAVRNQGGYDYSANLTVSERAFWKWLKHAGICSFTKRSNVYKDDSSIVKAFGKIAASNYRSDSYSIYNEIYVQIPSSFGNMSDYVEYKSVVDDNYGVKTYSASSSVTGIEGYCDNASAYTVTEDETLCLVLNPNQISNNTNAKSLDQIAIDSAVAYKFNAILLYYSIYDGNTSNIISTNLFGILFVGGIGGSRTSIDFETLDKNPSNSTMGLFGNGYSFRINLKTNDISGTEVSITDGGSTYTDMISDFNGVTANLAKSVELIQNNIIYSQQIAEKYDALTRKVNAVLETVNTSGADSVPVDHSSESEDYGIGTSSKYGHVKVSTNYSQPSSDPATTLAQSAAVNMYKEVLGKIGSKDIQTYDFDGQSTNVALSIGDNSYMYLFKNMNSSITYTINMSYSDTPKYYDIIIENVEALNPANMKFYVYNDSTNTTKTALIMPDDGSWLTGWFKVGVITDASTGKVWING